MVGRKDTVLIADFRQHTRIDAILLRKAPDKENVQKLIINFIELWLPDNEGSSEEVKWKRYKELETGQLAGDDEKIIRRISLKRPIEAHRIKIVVPNRTTNGACYLRIGYDAFVLKQHGLGDITTFVEMRHQSCD